MIHLRARVCVSMHYILTPYLIFLSFQIAVNGRHFCEFRHRIPLSTARFIHVTRQVKIHSIRIEGDPNTMAPSAPSLTSKKQSSLTIKQNKKIKIKKLLSFAAMTTSMPSYHQAPPPTPLQPHQGYQPHLQPNTPYGQPSKLQ